MAKSNPKRPYQSPTEREVNEKPSVLLALIEHPTNHFLCLHILSFQALKPLGVALEQAPLLISNLFMALAYWLLLSGILLALNI